MSIGVIAAAAVSGGGADLSPAVRGAKHVLYNGSSVTVTWPAGTVAGDLVVMSVGSAFSVSTPSGWTVLDAQNSGTNVRGAAFSKALTSTDITTGSVTVALSGSFNGTVGMVAFVGATAGVREVSFIRSGSGATSVARSTSAAVLTSDTLIWFGHSRGDSTTGCSRGVQQQIVNGANASGGTFTENVTSAGVQSGNITHSVAGAGYYDGVVVVKGV